jgi:hypothetical protein
VSLSRRALNRALLARQHLLERADRPLPRVLEDMGGLQAQYAPSMYVGLWSRLEAFTRNQLDAALEARSVVQATLMRGTIHLVSRRDFWPLAEAVRGSARPQWLRLRRLADGDMQEAAVIAREALREGPLRRRELDELVGTERAGGLQFWLDLVRVPPSGTWARRRADLYAAAEDWLGPSDATADDGLELLVRRYLAAFGPAGRADISSWAGVRIDADRLEQIGLTQLEDDLFDLPGAPLPGPETAAPVRFLGTWDAALMVHARRTGLLPEEYRPRIFSTRTPHSFNTFLVDGTVAGAWRITSGRIELEPFAPLGAATTRRLREEADRLAVLYA